VNSGERGLQLNEGQVAVSLPANYVVGHFTPICSRRLVMKTDDGEKTYDVNAETGTEH
jgi:hypothetical protein